MTIKDLCAKVLSENIKLNNQVTDYLDLPVEFVTKDHKIIPIERLRIVFRGEKLEKPIDNIKYKPIQVVQFCETGCTDEDVV